MMEADVWGGLSDMIRAAIGLNHQVDPVVFRNLGHKRGNGINGQRYINMVLRLAVLPYVQQHHHLVFQHDNA